MKRIFISALLIASISLSAQTVYKLGGSKIKIPAPAGLSEIGSKYKEKLNVYALPDHEVICGFFTEKDLKELRTKEEPLPDLNYFALVQSHVDWLDNDAFAVDLPGYMKNYCGLSDEFEESPFSKTENELSKKLDEIDIKSLDKGRPAILGLMFAKIPAAASAEIIAVDFDGINRELIACHIIIYAKGRIFNAYLFKAYKSKKDLHDVGTAGEKWAEAIIKANK